MEATMTRVEHTTRGKGDKTMGEDGPPVSHYRNPGGGRSGMIYKSGVYLSGNHTLLLI
jgi:hypothetical protein